MIENKLSTQIYFQLKRQFKIKIFERFNLIVSFVITPTIAWLSALIFRSNSDLVQNQAYTSFLYFMLISGVFFGLISSIFEVIKDRRTVQREKIGGVSVFGYYLSKYYVLAFFGFIQSLLYNLIGMIFLHIPWLLVIFNSSIMFLMVVMSISVGLFVSSLTRSNLVASNLIPILIIPQILLGGMIPYKQMDTSIFMWSKNYNKAPPITALIPIKYAYESIVTGNVAFTTGNNEINDKISQTVDFLQDNKFMSIDKDTFISNDKFPLFSKTWFYDILVIIGYIISTFILGYMIFHRRIFNG